MPMIELTERLANLSPAKRKLLEQRLQEKPQSVEPIAIIGMACRFPGVRNLEDYWRLISEGIDATSEVPPSRWSLEELYDPTGETPGKMSVKWGGFVDDVDLFDPMFFGITPREASRMDPQQRLLLETAWEAIEHAGLPPDQVGGSKTGVFVGIGGSDYSKIPSQFENYYEYIDAHVGTGNALSIAANRISYIFDFKGPSFIVDTACSSALVALHSALLSLRNRECDAALAGGVNLILSPEVTLAFSKARMLSSDGKCRPFDAGANGYVRGEGCALILLKRLTDAVKSGDQVLAVIRGSAINQDGRTSGITAPNAQSQQQVIRAALAQAGMTPERVSYIEAHGTGTPLGDPIEFQSLTQLFRRKSEADSPVYVTSVKANIGHTETVSGMAGLIKTVLLLQHGVIPGQLHLKELNPHIDLEGTRLVIPREPIAWAPNSDGPRVAGISSFGFGGANAHVVLEEATLAKQETPPAPERDRPLHVLTLSAKNDAALHALANEYLQCVQQSPSANVADIAYTANVYRTHFNDRAALVVASAQDLQEKLTALAKGEISQGVVAGQVKIVGRPKVAFIFTGQGSQYPGMGKGLYEAHPVFRAALDECDDLLRQHLDEPLLSVLFSEDSSSPLHETAYTQPALFSLEYALARLWQSWGVQPDIVLGHSVGEYVAACLAGVFDLEDGLALIAHRARLMQQLPRNGLMAVVFSDPATVERAIEPFADRVAIAAANGPQNTVISGEADSIRKLGQYFESRGVGLQMLTVSHAFHSPLMEPMLDEFEQLAREVSYHAPRISVVSNLTGELLEQTAPDAEYWRRHIRQAVRFAEGMERLVQEEVHAIIEVGPTPSLMGMARRFVNKSDLAWLPSLRKGQDDWRTLLQSVAELHVLGANIDWRGFDASWPRRRVSLPAYPFQRTRHWFEIEGLQKRTFGGTFGPELHPLLGSAVPSALDAKIFQSRFSDRTPKWLADHQVQGSVVTPAAAYLEMAMAAARQVFGEGNHVVENLSIQKAMYVAPGAARIVQTTTSPEMGGESTVEIFSSPADAEDGELHWTLHACARIRHADAARQDDGAPAPDPQPIVDQAIDVRTRDDYYASVSQRGLTYGPAFQVLGTLYRTAGEAVADVDVSDNVVRDYASYLLHPALLDGAFQAVAGALPLESDGSDSPYTYMPISLRRLRIRGDLTEQMRIYVRRTEPIENTPSPEQAEADIFLLDAEGNVLVEALGLRLQRVGRAARPDEEVQVRDWLYEIQWQEQPLSKATASEARSVDQSGPWLIFVDDKGVADAFAEMRRAAGQRCVLVRPGDEFEITGEDSFTISPLSGEHYRRLLEEVAADGAPVRAAIHFWCLDIEDPALRGQAAFEDARRLGCGSALQLIQQLARVTTARPPALWLVTQGAQPVTSREGAEFCQSSVWGLGRVAALEHPELHCRLLDLSPGGADVAMLDRELTSSPQEDQIAHRDHRRFVARLANAPTLLPDEGEQAHGLTIPKEGACQLRFHEAGSFDSLYYSSFSRRAPDSNQVEIEVRATGLNFSDVLKAMGLYPGITDKIVPLGIECAGVVTAVGDEAARRFQIGDEVMGVAPYSFATHALTAEYAVVKKPKDVDFDEAATIPITFLTAYYALVRLAHLAPGERVLIHAGAGGVGIAAIQIALHLGAEVFATAGSEEKREFLRALGVPHVHSSRTTEFAEEILQLTRREGVDIVLNSLPGEAITKSLETLRAYGRFLEIGKTDIYQNRMIGLAPFQDNLSYFAIDLDRMLRQRPDYIRDMFAEMMKFFESGHFRPLPLTRFAMDQTVDAFRYMAQRKNIGKVVVSFEDRPQASDEQPNAPRQVCTDATYLITGGLGALGLQVAQWLAAHGARHLALLGRRAPTEAAVQTIRALEAEGVRVAAIQGDVADAGSLKKALAQIPREFPPLHGVIHAAGVLDDGVLYDMDLARLDRTMTPKLRGAWNLHTATLDAPLDFFVLFSSIACLLGSPGQGNYAAGNAAMDGLAHYRRKLGLPALAINWGPWADSGMAAEAGRDAQLTGRGMDLIPVDRGLSILGRLLQSDEPQAAVMSVRWGDLLRQSGGDVPPILRDVAPQAEEGASSEAADARVDHELRSRLLSASLEERQAILRVYFTKELAKIMGLEPASLNVEQPLNTLGLDSLMAIELKNNIETRLKVVIPMARFMEGPSVVKLASAVAETLVQDAATTVKSSEPHDVGLGALSRGQQALWFIQRLAPEGTAYNMVDAVRVRGPLNLEALEHAVQSLAQRHEVFRTTFPDEHGVAQAVVHDVWTGKVRVENAATWDEDQLHEAINDELQRPFDLAKGPVWRVALFQAGVDDWLMTFAVHHIISDFWSLVMCTSEFQQFYEAYAQGRSLELPPPKLQYSDFTRWQTKMLAGPEGATHWDYWRQELSGELPVLNMPTDRPRPPVQTYNGSLSFHRLKPSLTARLKALADANGATLNMVLLAGWQALLHRYSGQTDILIGAPTSGRTRAEFADVAGYFVNPVVIRGNLSDDPRFADFVGQMRGKMLGALDHQDYPFPMLVQKLHVERDPSRSPLVQVMFVMQKAQIMHEQGLTPFLMGQSGATMRLAGLAFESMTLDQWAAQFDLSLAASEAEGGVSLGLQYNTDLFDAETIREMLEHLETLLDGAANDPSARVSKLPMLTAAEERKLLVEWNLTARANPTEIRVHEAFEQQTTQTPQAVALVCGDQTLTYRELNERANRLAHFLRRRGVGPDARVGVCFDRSVDLVVSIYAVLKAGGAYVPLDPAYPLSRLSDIATSSGMHVVLTHTTHRPHLGDCCEHIACLDDANVSLAEYSPENPTPVGGPENLIYVIFTSGSTGKPKGAAVYHRGFSNLMHWYLRELEMSDRDRSLLITSHGFDLTQKNFYAALMVGGQLHLSTGQVYDPTHLLAEIAGAGATLLNCTPSHIYSLVSEAGDQGLTALDGLRNLVLGGEPIDVAKLSRWTSRKSCKTHIINSYGPTECTDVVGFHRLGHAALYRHRAVPLGRPIDNTEFYILNDHLTPVPIGAIGELCLGGVCVGAGYINDPALTQEKFVSHPFANNPQARLYRTGDVCRYLPDGNVEFVGRKDHQVKVRGFRIELGEIEARLMSLENVHEAVVLARQDSPDAKRLVAYVVPKPGQAIAAPDLAAQLRESLPVHMIPAAFVVLGKFPLTPHGKVDRRALPAPELSHAAVEYIPPRTPIEEVLAEVWTSVLPVERVGVHDNFFELGGDSILSIQVVSRLADRGFSCRPIHMLQYPTIAELAKVVGKKDRVAEQGEVTGEVDLLPIQHWFLNQESPNRSHFNQSLLLEIPQQLSPKRLAHALREIVAHHDALRLRFKCVNGRWRQTCEAFQEAQLADLLHAVDLHAFEAEQASAEISRCAAEAQASLNLETGPLLRAVYFDLGEDRASRLLLVVHHLAVDIVSWRILLEDLLIAYHQLGAGVRASLPPKSTSYQAWARHLVSFANSQELRDEASFWIEVGSDSEPLPVDQSGANTFASMEENVTDLDFASTERLLKEATKTLGASMQGLLLAALGETFTAWTGKNRLLVNLEGHGREDLFEDVDLSRTVGWFVNVYPVMISTPSPWTPEAGARDVTRTLAKVPRHGLGYGLLRWMRDDEVAQTLAENPHPEVMFTYLGQLDQDLGAGMPLQRAAEVDGPAQCPDAIRPYLFEIIAFIRDGQLHVQWLTSRNRHRQETVRRLAERYVQTLKKIATCI
jgi:myxalamid-type polyketide synthase MxaB